MQKTKVQQISDLVRKHKEYATSFKLIDRGNHTESTIMYRYKWNANSMIPLREVKRRIDKHLIETTTKILILTS